LRKLRPTPGCDAKDDDDDNDVIKVTKQNLPQMIFTFKHKIKSITLQILPTYYNTYTSVLHVSAPTRAILRQQHKNVYKGG
jgi:hypothetical protein